MQVDFFQIGLHNREERRDILFHNHIAAIFYHFQFSLQYQVPLHNFTDTIYVHTKYSIQLGSCKNNDIYNRSIEICKWVFKKVTLYSPPP